MQVKVVLSDAVKKAAQKYQDAYAGKRVKDAKGVIGSYRWLGVYFSSCAVIFVLVGVFLLGIGVDTDGSWVLGAAIAFLALMSLIGWVPVLYQWYNHTRKGVVVQQGEYLRHVEEKQFLWSAEALSEAIVCMDAALFDLVEKAHWCFRKRIYRGSEEVPERSLTCFAALHFNHSIDLSCLLFLVEEKYERGLFSEHSNAPDQICGVPYERYEHLCFYMKSPGAFVQLKELLDTWRDREMTLLEAVQLTEARNKIVETFAKQVTTEDLAQKTED